MEDDEKITIVAQIAATLMSGQRFQRYEAFTGRQMDIERAVKDAQEVLKESERLVLGLGPAAGDAKPGATGVVKPLPPEVPKPGASGVTRPDKTSILYSAGGGAAH